MQFALCADGRIPRGDSPYGCRPTADPDETAAVCDDLQVRAQLEVLQEAAEDLQVRAQLEVLQVRAPLR